MRRSFTVFLVEFFVLVAIALAQEANPLVLKQTIPLPNVEGRIDHFAVDVKGLRLFVAALGNNTVEVIDLEAGERVYSVGGLREPQGVLYVPESNEVFVTNAGNGACNVFDGDSFELVNTINFSSDADNIRYDPKMGLIYVGFGNGALGIIDAGSEEHLYDIGLAGHPESFQLEQEGSRIFVNVPPANHIAVVDREQGVVTDRWPVTLARSNFPMALDEANNRLFIGCRNPARILVYDTASGMVVANLPSAGDADDIFYDADNSLIYLSGGEGFLTVFAQSDADHYQLLTNIPTADGARTSRFVPELGRLYLAVPHRGNQAAEIRVYQVQP